MMMPQGPAAPMDPNADPATQQKMMLAHALMGGGGAGANSGSLAGGISGGLGPLIQQMMMQKMMQPQPTPFQPAAPMPMQAPMPSLAG